MFQAQCFDIQKMGLPQDTRSWIIQELFEDYGNDCWHDITGDIVDWIDGDVTDDGPGNRDCQKHIDILMKAIIADGWDKKSRVMLKVWW